MRTPLFLVSLLYAALLLAPPVAAAPSPGIPEAASDTDEEPSDLVRVFQCRFDEDWDVNYDAWPDRWERVYDDEHPQYARIQIETPDDPSIKGRALVIRADGASATAISPPIHVMPKFSYKLRCRAKLTGAETGTARVRMTFHNHRDETHQVVQTLPLPSDGVWHEVDLGDFQPENGETDRVYAHFDYTRGARGDLHAELLIADIRLYRLPSIKIQTDSLYNVYTKPTDVEVTCSLSGILEQNPEVRFQLLDGTNKEIGEGGSLTIDGKIISETRTLASDIVDGFGSDKSSYEGSKKWRPPIQDYGFYRVKVGMYHANSDTPIGESRSITLAVVRDGLESSERGEFGWSLPKADNPLPFAVLQELLPRAGVRMVKLPVWFPVGDEKRGEELMRFAEQLAARGIDTVGVLEDPTFQIADPLTNEPPPIIEGLLSADPSYWTPLIDHVITRLSLRIRLWQLGRDGDTSFVGYKRLIERIGAIRNQMFRFGQDIRMGIGWRWDHAESWGAACTWDFEQMSGREQLNARGLDAALTAAPPSTAQRWVLVEPPAVDTSVPAGADPNNPNDPVYRRTLVQRHQERVRDFVEQMLVAKMHGAEGIFVANPFSGSPDISDARTGVMNDDGTPGELLLPWRTCARLLGGADYLGSIRLPHSSKNWLFKRPDGRVVMVLWNLDAETLEANATPVEETLYLGENIQVVDIWGAAEKPELVDGDQVIRVGRMPRFVMGLDEGIARWRMGLRFETVEIPSVFGVSQPNALIVQNAFGQGVGGTMKVFVPAQNGEDEAMSTTPAGEWDIEVQQPRFSLAANEEMNAPLALTLRNAGYGPQLVRCDFELSADREYRFSVWRELNVALKNVSLEVDSYIDAEGALVIEQRMRNDSGVPIDFKCSLYAKDRRRKRAQVFQLGPETDTKRYTYLNPEGLVGKTMTLQVEESDGSRKLIHRFEVKPRPADAVESGLAGAL